MARNDDRFKEAYLRGDIRVNLKAVIALAAVAALLVAAASFASRGRIERFQKRFDKKVAAMAEEKTPPIISMERAASQAEIDPKWCDGTPPGDPRPFRDSRLTEFDYYMRNNLSFAQAGFSAGVAFRHKSGNYIIALPGGLTCNETPWHFHIYEDCIREMLDRGACTTENRTSKNKQDFYSFSVIRNPKTGKIAAVLLAALLESAGTQD